MVLILASPRNLRARAAPNCFIKDWETPSLQHAA